MNNIKIIVTGILIACGSICLSMDSKLFETCKPNTRCSQDRGLIRYDWSQMPASKRHLFNGKSWIIRPSDNVRTTVTIAFRDFEIKKKLYIAINSGGNMLWRKISGSVGTSFELIATEVNSFTIYVQSDERGSFNAYFYVGCTVVTKSSGEILHPSPTSPATTCWVVKPIGLQDLSRVYFAFRDVYLSEGSRVSVTDLHTNLKIAGIDQSIQYDIYGNDVTGQETVLIEQFCENSTCPMFGNMFSLSYYSLSNKDVACIETQRQCALDPWMLPQPICEQPCPQLDRILEEEMMKEGPVFDPQEPVVKSGVLPTAVKIIEHVTRQANQTQATEESIESEKEEKEVVEEESVPDKRLRPSPKPTKCQLKGKYCRCLRTVVDAKRYCFSKQKCKAFKSCAIGCIFARIMVCAKMTSSARVELIGG